MKIPKQFVRSSAPKYSAPTPTSQTISVAASKSSSKPTHSTDDIEYAVQLSPPDLSREESLTTTPEKVLTKSLSQMIISLFSSKPAPILPESHDDNTELQQLEILQMAGRLTIDLEETGIPNIVENLEL